eukprot:1123458-Pyramimonas_sp.AAC.1
MTWPQPHCSPVGRPGATPPLLRARWMATAAPEPRRTSSKNFCRRRRRRHRRRRLAAPFRSKHGRPNPIVGGAQEWPSARVIFGAHKSAEDRSPGPPGPTLTRFSGCAKARRRRGPRGRKSRAPKIAPATGRSYASATLAASA